MKTIDQIELDVLHTVKTTAPLTGEGFDRITRIVHESICTLRSDAWYKAYEIQQTLETWWDWNWVTEQADPQRTTTTMRDGSQVAVPIVYRGNFPTRLSALYRHVGGIQMDNALKERIGNVYSTYRAGQADMLIRLTKDVEWSDGVFGDGGSCFWSYNSPARYLIEEKGWALQRFTDHFATPREFRQNALSRCWILPYEYRGQQCYIAFNGYSNHASEDGYGRTLPVMADALAQLLEGVTHRVEFENDGTPDGVLYINSGRGVIIAPNRELVEKLTIVEMHHHLEPEGEYTCYECGDRFSDDGDMVTYGDEYLCSYCYERYYFTCDKCLDVSPDSAMVTTPDGQAICSECAEGMDTYCCVCKNFGEEDTMQDSSDNGGKVCESCAEGMEECPRCGKLTNDMRDVGGIRVCWRCSWR